jgi:RNA polymerase sigma factor FliA
MGAGFGIALFLDCCAGGSGWASGTRDDTASGLHRIVHYCGCRADRAWLFHYGISSEGPTHMTLTSAEQAYQRSQKPDRDSMVLEHLRLVRHVLKKHISELPDSVDLENLEAAGTLGLVEAAHNYDPSRGVPFGAFARRRIQGAILDELRRNSPLPQSMMSRITKIRKCLEQAPSPATPEWLAEATGMTLDEIASALEAMRMSRIRSWDDGDVLPWELASDESSTPDYFAERHELLQVMAEAIQGLPEKERIVLAMYHQEDLRLREIGELMGLSESRVSRLVATAEFRLANRIRSLRHQTQKASNS